MLRNHIIPLEDRIEVKLNATAGHSNVCNLFSNQAISTYISSYRHDRLTERGTERHAERTCCQTQSNHKDMRTQRQAKTDMKWSRHTSLTLYNVHCMRLINHCKRVGKRWLVKHYVELRENSTRL